MKLPPPGDNTQRTWSRRELEALIRNVALPAISDKRRQILEDFGMMYLDGRFDIRQRNGDVVALVDQTEVGVFMQKYFNEGKRVRVLFIPEEALGDLDVREPV
jgi:hypothetical protein